MMSTMVRSSPIRIGVSSVDFLPSVCSCSSTAGMNRSVMNTPGLRPFWLTAKANSLSESGWWTFGSCSLSDVNVKEKVGSSELVRFMLEAIEIEISYHRPSRRNVVTHPNPGFRLDIISSTKFCRSPPSYPAWQLTSTLALLLDHSQLITEVGRPAVIS